MVNIGGPNKETIQEDHPLCDADGLFSCQTFFNSHRRSPSSH